MELSPNVATMAEILRDHGYATLMVGKWHLAKDSDISDAGPRHSWPCQRGFDRFYGFLDGFTNLHHPHRLIEDNHAVEVDAYPDGYYLTDDLTDRAIAMVRSVKASDPAAAVLPLLRPRGGARAAARQGGRHRAVPRTATATAGTGCGRRATVASSSWASSPRAPSWRPATPSPTTTSRPGTS